MGFIGNHHRVAAKGVSKIKRGRPATSVHGFVLAFFRARARARSITQNSGFSSPEGDTSLPVCVSHRSRAHSWPIALADCSAHAGSVHGVVRRLHFASRCPNRVVFRVAKKLGI
jgi:hypothetical protein